MEVIGTGSTHEIPVSHAMHEKRRSRAIDRMIGELATRQHGVVARRQLTGLGIGRGAIEGRLTRGQLHSVHRGVYAVGHRRLSAEGRWLAAVLATGEDAVLSHRSAGQLWGLLPRSTAHPEVTCRRAWRSRSRLRVRRASLAEDETTTVDGIRVTSPARTQLDLAAISTRRQMERILNEAEVLGLTDRLSLPMLLERYPRRRGSALLRELLADDETLRGVTREELEKRFDVFVEERGLPRPRLNADIAVGGRFFRADCLWPERRLIVELDGRASHGTRRAFEKDRERDRLLLADGWRVVRVTWFQLRDEPAVLAADLRRILAVPPTLDS